MGVSSKSSLSYNLPASDSPTVCWLPMSLNSPGPIVHPLPWGKRWSLTYIPHSLVKLRMFLYFITFFPVFSWLQSVFFFFFFGSSLGLAISQFLDQGLKAATSVKAQPRILTTRPPRDSLLFFSSFYSNQSIVDLHYCANFCCIAKWLSYTQIYIIFFFTMV